MMPQCIIKNSPGDASLHHQGIGPNLHIHWLKAAWEANESTCCSVIVLFAFHNGAYVIFYA